MTGAPRINGFVIALLLMSALFFLSIRSAGSQSTSAPAGSRKGPGSELVGLVQPGDQFGSFKKAAEPEYYFPDTLFDYINGGAELFLAYGFVELLVAELVEDGNPDSRATLEIYNMGTLENAFGVFKAEQGGDPYKLPGGSDGRLGQGMLQFYKDKWYVKTFLPPASKYYPAVTQQIGTAIESRIKGTFSTPAFFKLLPVQDRVADSESYTSKDFLGQPYFARIASAQFLRGGKTYKIFISIEPDKEAAQHLAHYKAHLIQEKAYQGSLPGGIKGFAGQDPYYGHCVISVINGRITGVLDNPDDAVSILKSMGGKSDEKK
jgi:hypothetical protein